MSECGCDNAISHIIGSAFSVVLSASESPVTEGGTPLSDTAGWGVALEAVKGSDVLTITGSWLDSVGPVWRMLFEVSDTSGWTPVTRSLRLKFTGPDSRVFRTETDLQLECKR